ncbi:kinase-like domain-containing protein [Dichotomocladium elegans]|nr:kinase-like domain-containing protein [Dichotomocladium elegans]
MQFSSPAQTSLCRFYATGKLSVTRRKTANELLKCSHRHSSEVAATPLSLLSSCLQRLSNMVTHLVYGDAEKSSRDNIKIKKKAAIYSTRLEDYRLLQELGSGGSAVVFAATYRPKQTLIAVKRVSLDHRRVSDKDRTALRREIHILSHCLHPHIMSILQTFSSSTHMYIVMPMMIGSCRDLLTDFSPDGLNEALVACILKQAVSGLLYLHRNMIIHRDVKAANILLDQLGIVKLADFGASNYYHQHERQQQSKFLEALAVDHGSRSCKSFIGTPCWMAPEVIQNLPYNEKVDLWALGITAIELASGIPPYCDDTPSNIFARVIRDPPPTLIDDDSTAFFSAQFHAFVARCLQKDPMQRLSSDQASSHPFVLAALPPHYLATWLQSLEYPAAPSSSLSVSSITDTAEDVEASATASYSHFDEPLSMTVGIEDHHATEEYAPTTPGDVLHPHVHNRDLLLYTPKEFHLF